MEKEWIPVVGTLLGVLFGGGIGSFAKFLELRHQRKQEKSKLILSKLEDLHYLTCEYTHNLAEYGARMIKHHGNEIPVDELYSMTKLLTHPLTKITPILRIYAPEAESEFARLRDSIIAVNSYGNEYLNQNNRFGKKLPELVGFAQNNCGLFLRKIEQLTTNHTKLKIPQEIYSADDQKHSQD